MKKIILVIILALLYSCNNDNTINNISTPPVINEILIFEKDTLLINSYSSETFCFLPGCENDSINKPVRIELKADWANTISRKLYANTFYQYPPYNIIAQDSIDIINKHISYSLNLNPGNKYFNRIWMYNMLSGYILLYDIKIWEKE